MPSAKMSKLLVGLTNPDYRNAGAGGPGGGQLVTWQTDAKHYEFWARGNDDGHFSIPNVRPGTYTLHAFADGVLGEYAKTDITVEAGKPLDLAKLAWTPVRRGQQIWEIGVPNRNGSEFLMGDDFFHDGMQIKYAQLFPNDVNFVIGKSDYKKDWYYQQPPHADEATMAAAARGPSTSAGARLPGESAPAPVAAAGQGAGQPGSAAGSAAGSGGARGTGRGQAAPSNGRATPWNITFDMPAAQVHGTATLRAAFSGTGVRNIDVKINGESVGQLGPLQMDGTLGTLGNGIQGIWYEREFPFDAAKLKPGTNVMTLTVPAGALTAGVIYDYLRLELDENVPPPAAP
jgi:rhamnogalacturonan endolyase